MTIDKMSDDYPYQQLKQDILTGFFKPGEKLLMNTLKQRYDLGVGPLREILAKLVAEHLVVAINQKGYRVATMSIEEMTDIYEARARLEAMIVTMALERGGDDWEASVVASAHKLAKISKVESTQELIEHWDQRHKEFHNSIARGCQSKRLLQARAFLFDHAERYRQLWLKDTVMSEKALLAKHQEHSEILDAVLARDANTLNKMILEHLMTPVPVIKKIIEDQ